MAVQLATKATVTTTEQIKLAPALAKKLLVKFKAYQELKAQAEAIDAAMKAHKSEIRKLRESVGVAGLALEGFTTTNVAPVRQVLNHKKLVELGCALAWIEEATESKPSRPYEKITVPGGKDEE